MPLTGYLIVSPRGVRGKIGDRKVIATKRLPSNARRLGPGEVFFVVELEEVKPLGPDVEGSLRRLELIKEIDLKKRGYGP